MCRVKAVSARCGPEGQLYTPDKASHNFLNREQIPRYGGVWLSSLWRRLKPRRPSCLQLTWKSRQITAPSSCGSGTRSRRRVSKLLKRPKWVLARQGRKDSSLNCNLAGCAHISSQTFQTHRSSSRLLLIDYVRLSILTCSPRSVSCPAKSGTSIFHR